MIKAFIIYGNDGSHPIFAEFLDVLPHQLQYYVQNEPFQKIAEDILQKYDLKVYTEHYHSLRLVVYASRGITSGEGEHFLHVIRDMLIHLFNHGTERCIRTESHKLRKLLTLMVHHGKLVETRPNHLLQLLEARPVDQLRRNH